MKFTNTLKNNVQLGEEINGTKGTKQLQNKKTNIEHKTACLSQLINGGRQCCLNRKKSILPPYTHTISFYLKVPIQRGNKGVGF